MGFFDFYIIHSRADGKEYADKLASFLTDMGWSVLIDQWGTKPDGDIPTKYLKRVHRIIFISTSMQ